MAISQAVKQTISVRSGNDLRREIAAIGAFGESPLSRARLATVRSASVAPSIGMFIFIAQHTFGRRGRYFAFARFSSITGEVICYPSLEINAKATISPCE